MDGICKPLRLASAVAACLCIVAFQAEPVIAQQAPAQPQPGQAMKYGVKRSAKSQTFAWPAPAASDLVVTTGSSVEGFRVVTYRGLVEGVSVREPTGEESFQAEVQGMFAGGDVEAFGQWCEEGRVLAYNNMLQRARNMGANAVIGIRFDNELLPIDKEHTSTAVVCYGTAVVIEHK